MKRLRSSDELDSYSDKNTSKDSANPKPNRSSSSSHRSFYYKSDNVRKSLVSPSSSTPRYVRDRSLDDDNRIVRKRSEHEFESFERRKAGFDRYSNREAGFSGGVNDRAVIHRSESFCGGSRREFPKGFRSERDRSRREGSVSSWRRFGTGSKEFGSERKELGGERKELGGERKEIGSERKEIGSGNKEFEERASSRDERGRGLRDALKSPSWSRDSSSEQSRVRGLGESKSKSRSRSRSSPSWSKDSVGSEQSRSLEVVKKTVEVKIDSGNSSSSSSEMEEGELEPDAEREGKPDSALEEVKNENKAKESSILSDNVDKEVEEGKKVMGDVEKEGRKEGLSKGEKDGVREAGELLNNESVNVGASGAADEDENVASDSAHREGNCMGEDNDSRGGGEDKLVENPPIEEKRNKEKRIDVEVKKEAEIEVPDSNNRSPVEEENRGGEANVDVEEDGLNQNVKDKGKQIAEESTPDCADDSLWMEKESRMPLTLKAGDDMEGPSTRGFDLFTSSPVRKTEGTSEAGVKNKDKDGKPALEPLELSLSLPNVLLPIGAEDTGQAPGSPSLGRSAQSLNTFQTNSDGFTASMSFSGSQSFFHNPSCSLTHNSLDNFEQSVHSRPIFQGIDQVSQGACPGQLHVESSRHKDVPLYQKILMNGNGSANMSSASLECVMNGQPSQGQPIRVAEGSTKMSSGLERQLSFHKQNNVQSPSHSVESHNIGSNYSFEKRRTVREKHGGSSLYRSGSQKEQELLIGSADFVETIIGKIVSEPIHVMARKFCDMTGQPLACLKESIREFMLNAEKRTQLRVFQNALECRSDMNLEMLLKCHRAQLLILVALKTGLPEYLQLENSISSTELAEIFLNLRCRNVTCQSPLPVDECDCKVCAKKSGFCSACMCLVCSKYDMASNTCSWVGCDVCLHWCHADCGLRESYIRIGHSPTGLQSVTEMQFHCVACDHPSEMFGFVKEVFNQFAKDWSAETLLKELQYVKRIFSPSKDVRGRRLHEIAELMLTRLSNNKSHLPEVLNCIMGFLSDCESSKFVNSIALPEKEPSKENNIGTAGPSHEMAWFKSVYPDKLPQLGRSASLLPTPHIDHNDKRPVETELQRSTQKEPLFDELESIVRIKLAEAKMFQARADDARREADGLKRIAVAKNEKIEEEYTSRITKLRLVGAEEMRKQRFEEFQAMERAHREYSNMKVRMEADIKDLLLKMEATRRNLAL